MKAKTMLKSNVLALVNQKTDLNVFLRLNA